VPKIKTNRAAAKRFKMTATGKAKRARSFKSHLLSSKGRKRKRRLRHSATVSPSDMKSLRRLLPYG